MLSLTQVVTEEQHAEPTTTKKKRTKCHGNRKLQRFKRKCRAGGLTEEQIIAHIQNRTNATSERLLTSQAIPERTLESYKRKRDDQSTQIS